MDNSHSFCSWSTPEIVNVTLGDYMVIGANMTTLLILTGKSVGYILYLLVCAHLQNYAMGQGPNITTAEGCRGHQVQPSQTLMGRGTGAMHSVYSWFNIFYFILGPHNSRFQRAGTRSNKSDTYMKNCDLFDTFDKNDISNRQGIMK